jgi:hypothetical protein
MRLKGNVKAKALTAFSKNKNAAKALVI